VENIETLSLSKMFFTHGGAFLGQRRGLIRTLWSNFFLDLRIKQNNNKNKIIFSFFFQGGQERNKKGLSLDSED